MVGSTTTPTLKGNYYIGNHGLYFVKGLMNDPTNSYLAYLFTIDKNTNRGTFGVFKMGFSNSPY